MSLLVHHHGPACLPLSVTNCSDHLSMRKLIGKETSSFIAIFVVSKRLFSPNLVSCDLFIEEISNFDSLVSSEVFHQKTTSSSGLKVLTSC